MPNKSSNTGKPVAPPEPVTYFIVRGDFANIYADEDGFAFHTDSLAVARVQLMIVRESTSLQFRIVTVSPDGTLGEVE